jgi:fibronectin-binding autotransporter adhesin
VTAAGGALFGQSFIKMSGNTFTSNSVTVQGPNGVEAFGGAVVSSSGIITSSANVFTSNTATEAVGTGVSAGGAIATLSATVVSTGDSFKSNAVVNGGNIAGGGAGFFGGTSLINNPIVSGNHATGGIQGIGGGFALTTSGEISKGTFTGNGATASAGPGAGGAIFEEGGGVVLNSTLTGNAASALGGGMISAGSGTIVGSTISGNAVTAAAAVHEGGGGVYSASSLEISQSTLANNSVTVSGAGSSGGGGILSMGTLTMDDSTVSGNSVLGSAASSGGGGIYDAGTSTFQNDTISNNASKLDAGGIDVAASVSITLQNVTLFKNAAIGSGGNILNPFTMSLTNSIVAGGTASSGADIRNTGTITSGDYNIIGSAVVGNPIAGTTTHNKTANPLLLTLSNNGGPTFTNADQATSPGKAYIPYAAGNCGGVSLTTDQRGYTRGAGARCDVGAFEFGGVPSAARHHTQPRRAAPASHFELHLRPIRLHAIRLPNVSI